MDQGSGGSDDVKDPGDPCVHIGERYRLRTETAEPEATDGPPGAARTQDRPMKPHVLPDHLAPGLTAIFVGTAAGEASARRGHYYAGPGNEFWQLLADAGLTPEFLGPERDAEVLAHGLGLTDVAKHRSGNDAVLAARDFDVDALVAKVARHRPVWVAFTSKGAAQVVSRALGRGRFVSVGRQAWTIGASRVFVLPSPSGSNRSPAVLEGKASRLDWYREFREVMQATRSA
jgi:TDG/mug DNA glycosylase family protein